MSPERAEELIREALLEHPEITFEQVLADLASGYAIAFEEEDGIGLVRLYEYSTGELETYGWLWACRKGRFFSSARELIPQIIAFAASRDCDWVEIRTRPGAGRVLKRFGFELLKTEDDGDTVILRRKL